MEIIYKRIEDIKPYPNNPRANDNAVAAVKASIENFGFKVPLVLDEAGVIICGHTRYKAAKLLKMGELPCVIAHLTEEQAKAYRIADNRTQDNAEWDYDLLTGEMELLEELGVDLSETGFSEGEINNILGYLDGAEKAGELDLGDFGEEKFKHKCSCCGFRW